MPAITLFYCLLALLFAGNRFANCVPIQQFGQQYGQQYSEEYGQQLGHQSDVCDWEGSGSLEADSERVVVPVYLRCSHGTVKWYYPKGGLRVVLRYGTNSKSFRGCVRVARNSSNVRMYIEGHQQLHKLYASDDGKHIDLLRCFVSLNGKMAIFIKAENTVNSDLSPHFVKFSYDLQSVSSESDDYYDSQECRPCDDNEMLSLFCTSDFIIEGTIHSLYHNNELQRSELTIRAHNIIKDPIDSSYSLISNNYYNNSSVDRIMSEYGITKYFTLYRPLVCGTKAGSGTQFIFFGRWLLGNPIISCAPKLTYWKHVRSKAIENGSNQCQLV